MKTKACWLTLALALAGGACGGDSAPVTGDEDVPLAEVPGEVAGDEAATPDPVVHETAEATEAVESIEPDLVFPDLISDTTPPTVVKTEPAAEATGVPIPFVVKVTFSEGIRFQQTIDKNTFQVKDLNGKVLPGKFSYDDKTFTVTWTPDASVVFLRASPYQVTLTTIIQDLAGNRLADFYTFAFSTELPEGAEAYKALAAKYSPIIYQATSKNAPQFDYLTVFDFDGNWVANDNEKAIKKATEVPSWVYYDVVESKTHFFIRYVYFWPLHFGKAGDGSDTFANDVTGATVVVQKRPQERPIAVLTYLGLGAFEEVRSYVTNESGIVADPGKGPGYYGVNRAFGEAELFPAGHYQAYLSAQAHESCLWNHTTKETPLDGWCLLNEGIKSTLSVIRYTYDGTPTPIAKQGGAFPASLASDVGYDLRSLMADWWARRDHIGEDSMFSGSFTYEPDEDHPVGPNTPLPTAFVSSPSLAGTSRGRPPWAWEWKDSVNPDVLNWELPKGSLFLDPVYFFQVRHRITVGVNPETKEGYSDQYCYNPYLLIDQRETDPDCK